MQELFLNLISRFFNRQRSLDDLCDALEKYQNDKQNLAAQLRLEAAFYKAYKKKASAKLIDRLAKSDWGPREALSVFGRTSPVVRCNFNTHNLVLGRWLNLSRTKRALFALLLGLPAIVVGAATVFIGVFLLYVVFFGVYLSGAEEILKEGIDTGLKIYLVSIIGIGASIFGVFFAYTGWDLVAALESEDKALQLYEQLNADS